MPNAARQRSSQEDDRDRGRADEQARLPAPPERDPHGRAAEDHERGAGSESDGGARGPDGPGGDEHPDLRRREEARGKDRGAGEGVRGPVGEDRGAAAEEGRAGPAAADALAARAAESRARLGGCPPFQVPSAAKFRAWLEWAHIRGTVLIQADSETSEPLRLHTPDSDSQQPELRTPGSHGIGGG